MYTCILDLFCNEENLVWEHSYCGWRLYVQIRHSGTMPAWPWRRHSSALQHAAVCAHGLVLVAMVGPHTNVTTY